MQDLIKHINRYIEFLKKDCSLNITLHDAGGYFLHNMELLCHNIHSNSFCMQVKTCTGVWNCCIQRQEQLVHRLGNGAIADMCYMGVKEYIFPIKYDNKVVGFVCVSGYGDDDADTRKCLSNASKNYGFDYDKLRSLHQNALNPEMPEFDRIETLISPLCYMLGALCIDKPTKTCSRAEYIFAHTITYINHNCADKITVDDLCALCHCSPSYLIRVFKRFSGRTISSYINDSRIAKAKRLLESTELSVTDIAYSCGFSDSNYFSNTFKKTLGLSPREYRKQSAK